MAFLFSGNAQVLCINELYNSSSQDEWIELLTIADSLDLRGFQIRDFSQQGVPQPALVFTDNAIWASVPRGTIILVARGETAFSEDTDPSDNRITIKSTNPLFFTGSPFSFGATSDAVQVLGRGGSHVIGVSWGSANASSIPQPKVHFTPGVSSATSIAFQGGSLAGLLSASDWTFTTTVTPGVGNSPANLAWIAALRATADGSGTARATPDTLTHGQAVALRITYRKDTTYPAIALRIILPSAFQWSRSTADVNLNAISAAMAVSGDTIALSALVMAGDSGTVLIAGVVPPDSTGFYVIRVESKSQTSFRSVSPQPVVKVFGLPAPIAAVKGNDANGIALRAGQLVTTRGIVTVASQFGGPSYIQDNTSGIAVFGSSFSSAVSIGDEVIVSGIVDPFNGLAEITSPLLHAVVSKGNVVDPLPVTCAQASNDGSGGVEVYEGLLVRINAVTLRDMGGGVPSAWTVTGSGTNYRLIDPTDTVEVRIDDLVDLANKPAPQGTFDIIGVMSQYRAALPYIGGYQIMPRSQLDIRATGPGIASAPVESDLTPTSFRVSWITERPGTTRLRVGTTSAFERGVIAVDTFARTSHAVVVTDLDPATIYVVQAFSVSGTDTSAAGPLIVSTSSPTATSGVINVYFNKSVDPRVASGSLALGIENLVNRLVQRISNARRSIDAAFYSLSGTPGSSIATALVAARTRGVRVRVIYEQDNGGTAPLTSLQTNGVPIISDAFDPANGGTGLMHNKFVVVDARGGAPESVWVWTGSWNPTLPGTNDDYQNAIELQDVALGKAYTVEFEEMWGSNTETPSASASRFGQRKTNNTPHRFLIGGVPVQSYFSPSDQTTSHLVETLKGAQHDISFALLTLTRSDLADPLIKKKVSGVSVRGVMDNGNDSGSEYSVLISSGIDVKLKVNTSGLLHHKYAVVDATGLGTPRVITGSHNWTGAAETTNNENTLIIDDRRIANLYLQEFAARYYQFGGNDSIRVGVDQQSPDLPQTTILFQNYPNPFNASSDIRYQVSEFGHVRLVVYDVLGREVATLVNERQPPGVYSVMWNAAAFASGVYFSRLEAGNVTRQSKMVLVR